MAQLLVAGDATVPNALSAYLRETLPDDFIVVSDPAVQGCAADAIAVGPGGLTLIAGGGSRPAADQPEPRRRRGHDRIARRRGGRRAASLPQGHFPHARRPHSLCHRDTRPGR